MRSRRQFLKSKKEPSKLAPVAAIRDHTILADTLGYCCPAAASEISAVQSSAKVAILWAWSQQTRSSSDLRSYCSISYWELRLIQRLGGSAGDRESIRLDKYGRCPPMPRSQSKRSLQYAQCRLRRSSSEGNGRNAHAACACVHLLAGQAAIPP